MKIDPRTITVASLVLNLVLIAVIKDQSMLIKDLTNGWTVKN